MQTRVNIYVDGASKDGIGGIGVVVYSSDSDRPIKEISESIGKATNNQAEYRALIAALRYAKENKLSEESVTIFSDSQLVVKQLSGEFKVKSRFMFELYLIARKLLSEVNCEIIQIAREHNKKADILANHGMLMNYNNYNKK